MANPTLKSTSRKSKPSRLLVGFILFLVFAVVHQILFPSQVVVQPKTPGELAQVVVEDKGIVPIFVGKNARVSLRVAESLSYQVSFSSLTHPDAYVNTSSQTFAESYVCYQSVLAGSPLVSDLPIKFVVDPSCIISTPTMLIGDYGLKAGIWQPETPQEINILDNKTVEGWVVGTGDQYDPQSFTVMTAFGEQTFALSLVKPATDWCESDFLSEVYVSGALEQRDNLLSFGQPVRLVLAEGNGFNDAFVTQLDASGQPISTDSVNEQLIKSGYWVPDGLSISESDVLQSPIKRKWVADAQLLDSKLQADYAKKITREANLARTQKDSPVGICLAKEQKDWLTWN